ncbi:GreA/GreB family elongation factor [Halosquirtibacter xylanolyticus]|uniref:hypothetical protein n=1 Tax=Halosquirtibacter xylanolyticus TaxID=3374599 RepID=UPI003748DE61|nr:GreA/GreB family elongation factor [Prolixibacteraceae bacterium]
MKVDQSIKNQCLKLIEQKVREQIVSCRKQISDLKDSLIDDTKSSAGDKYESSRERVAKDLNRLELQCAQYLKNMTFISSLDSGIKDVTSLGSLVKTKQGVYFFSLPLGKITLGKDDFYALSITSPIGKAMLGTKVGDCVMFQGREITILDII